MQPTWEACKLTPKRTPSATTVAVRRLLQAYTQAHRAGSDAGRRIILEAVDEIQAMPELKHVDFSKVRRLTERDSPREAGAPGAVAAAPGSSSKM